jgi:hypothetical protein
VHITMDIPHNWKIRISIKHIGTQSIYEDEDWMYCGGYTKEEVLRRITPVLRAKEAMPKNKGVQLIIKELWKDKPIHYLSDEIINQICKVNMPKFLEEKKAQEHFEKNPPKYSKPSNLSAPLY